MTYARRKCHHIDGQKALGHVFAQTDENAMPKRPTMLRRRPRNVVTWRSSGIV